MTLIRRFLAAATTITVMTSGMILTASTVSAATLPVKGECYSLTYEQIKPTPWAYTAAPVPCDGPHTVEVYASGVIPAEDPGGKVTRANICTVKAAMKAAGIQTGTFMAYPVNLGNYTFTHGNGMNYVCTVGLQDILKPNIPNVRTIDMPLAKYLKNTDVDLGICRKGSEKQWTAHTLKAINCDLTHQWRITGYIYIGNADKQAYPGEKKIKAQVSRYCPDAWYYYPVVADWKHGTGDRYVTCMVRE